MSSDPSASTVSVTATSTAAASRTSQAKASAPAMPRSPPRRESSETRAPAPASVLAAAAPMPLLAPVTRATLPSTVLTRTPLSTVVRVRTGWGHVEGGVPLEEPHGLEREPDGCNRHHRPVLRPRYVVMAERIPDNDVPIIDRAVGARPLRQAGAAGMQIGVLTGRVALVRLIRRHPQVFADEACTLADRGVGLRERERRLTGHQAIPDRFAQPVADGRIDHLPPASGRGVNPALCRQLGLEPAPARLEGVPVRVARA